MPHRRVGLVVAVLLLASVAACGSEEDPTLDTGGTGDGGDRGRATTTSTASTPGDDIGDAAGPFGSTPASTPPAQRGLLVDVRHARHGDVYRVVFEFDRALPGYEVRFANRPIVQDGSGDEIAVGGQNVISVEFEPSSAVDLQGENAVETYTGPKRIRVEDAAVAEIVLVGDFEAQLVWAVGVTATAQYRVTALADPPRLVLDVR